MKTIKCPVCGNIINEDAPYTVISEGNLAERKIYSAADIARQRFEKFLAEKLKTGIGDTAAWEFFTFLLEQAEKHIFNASACNSPAYQKDQNEAKTVNNRSEEQNQNGEITQNPKSRHF